MTGSEHFSGLFKHINKYVPLQEDDLAIITSALRYKKVKRKESLLRELQI
jgi:hypothetical protein